MTDWNVTFDELMNRPYPSPNTSIGNCASIVFIFEYYDTRLLFCGEAPADCIMGELGHFELVKLSHHGSIRNISSTLLDRLDTDAFLICADGTSHPSKQTVAKMIQHYGTVTIYSNYTWWMNGFFKLEDRKYINGGQLIFKNV